MSEHRIPPDVLRIIANPKALADLLHQGDEERKQRNAERNAQARRNALSTFVPRRNGEYICPSCAAVVTNPEKHLDWHGVLAAAAAEASEAAWRGRPIG